jgi:hypothetical protein
MTLLMVEKTQHKEHYKKMPFLLLLSVSQLYLITTVSQFWYHLNITLTD